MLKVVSPGLGTYSLHVEGTGLRVEDLDWLAFRFWL